MRPTVVPAVLAVAAGLLAGCVSLTTPELGGAPAVSGTLSVSGPALGTESLAAGACRSGEYEVFLGADFTGVGSPLTARLAVEPLSGPGVRIFRTAEPFGPAVLVRRSDCAVFHFSLERTGWQINDVYALRVSLELDCTLPTGDAVRGSLSGASCY